MFETAAGVPNFKMWIILSLLLFIINYIFFILNLFKCLKEIIKQVCYLECYFVSYLFDLWMLKVLKVW